MAKLAPILAEIGEHKRQILFTRAQLHIAMQQLLKEHAALGQCLADAKRIVHPKKWRRFCRVCFRDMDTRRINSLILRAKPERQAAFIESVQTRQSGRARYLLIRWLELLRILPR